MISRPVLSINYIVNQCFNTITVSRRTIGVLSLKSRLVFLTKRLISPVIWSVPFVVFQYVLPSTWDLNF